MTSLAQTEDSVTFVMNLQRIKHHNKKGAKQDYFMWHGYIPSHVADDLGLKGDRSALKVSAIMPKWYELIDWHKKCDAFFLLPSEIRDLIKASGVPYPVDSIKPLTADVPKQAVEEKIKSEYLLLGNIICKQVCPVHKVRCQLEGEPGAANVQHYASWRHKHKWKNRVHVWDHDMVSYPQRDGYNHVEYYVPETTLPP